MPIFAVSDVVWQAIIAGLVTIALAWMNQRTKNAVERAGKEATNKVEEAALKVEAVKTAFEETTVVTAEKLAEMAKVGNMTHMLVNSAMMEQKRLLAVSTRALADRTHNPHDIKAAELAEKDSADHEKKQRALDASEGRTNA